MRPSILAALFLLLARHPAAAQQPGSVTGRAVEADGGAPITLSLVRLAPAAGGPGALVLTDSAGRFRFYSVTPGSYRLRVERIGYVSSDSDPFEVAAGQAVERTLRTGSRPVVLEAVVAVGNRCYTRAQMEDEPELAQLWAEARKSQETRRAFSAQYAWAVTMHTEGVGRMRLLRDRHIVRDTVLVSHPDSLAARRARTAAQRQAQGYGSQGRGGLMISIPDETEVLSDAFLTDHCVTMPVKAADGSWLLRFRPVREERGRVELRGTVHIDSATFVVTHVDFEHRRDGRRWAWGTLAFAPVATPFGAVRLPSRVDVSGDPSGMMGMVVQGFSGTVTFRGYRDFRRAEAYAASAVH